MGVVIVGAFAGMDKSSRGGIENILLANFAVSGAEEFMELFEKLGRSDEDWKAAFCDWDSCLAR